MLDEKRLIEIIKENELTSDEIIDLLDIDKVIASNNPHNILNFVEKNKNLSNKSLERLVDAMIATNCDRLMFCLIQHLNARGEFALVNKLIKRLIAMESNEYIYRVARDIKGAPVGRLARKIIAIGNAKYIYYFARDVKGAPLKPLLEFLLSKGEYEKVTKIGEYVSLTALLKITGREETKENRFTSFIEFIEENKSTLAGTNFIKNVLGRMIDKYDEYKEFLQVYIEYLLNPLSYSSENIKQLDEEYKTISATGIQVVKGKQKVKTKPQ